jgi:hypothetical protein
MGLQATNKEGRKFGGFGCPCRMQYQLTPLDVLTVDATVLTDNPSCSVSSTRRFSYRDTGTFGLNYSGDGLGCTVATTRQLFESTSAQLEYTLGPLDDRGMALAISHERDRYKIAAKLEVRMLCRG